MKLTTDADGDLGSIHFEFTEWAHKIEPLDKAPSVKQLGLYQFHTCDRFSLFYC